ncbi:MAG: ROK family protein [Elusimicrobia bacterium]|nr:ROK family protein [Elusimicrobiota bacterium]
MSVRPTVGVDVGGTFAKLGLVDVRGRVLRSTRIPTEPRRGPADFARRVQARVRGWDFDTIGLGLAGGVDAAAGALLFAPNLPGWAGFSFKRAFRGRVVVENDANAAVWGAYAAALKRRPRTVVGVTLGTGVGGGLIVDGRLHRGRDGTAGEIGHQVVEPGGAPCHCGKRGCLEAYAGSYGLARLARRLMRRPPSPLTPEALAAAAVAGDPGAGRVWREAGERLGAGLAHLVLALNPDAVLILGGVARAGRLILDPVRRAWRAQPFQVPFARLALHAPAEREWGLVGAALLAREARKH